MKSVLTVLISLMLFLVMVQSSEANLITNDSFEDGAACCPSDFTPWVAQVDAYNVGIGCCRPERVLDGDQWASFNAGQTPPTGYVEQTINVTPGQLYRLTFLYGKFGGGGGNATFHVTVTGATTVLDEMVIDSTPSHTSGEPTPEDIWNSASFDFVADSVTVTVKFQDASSNNGSNFDNYLDAVSVVSTDANPGAATVQFDAFSLALQNGDPVSFWGDQTAGGTPTYLTIQTPNGGPAVEFNGGGDRMGDNVFLSPSASGDWIVAAVIRPDSIGAYHNLVDDDAQNRPMLWIDPSFNYELNFSGGTGAKGAGMGSGGWDIVIADSRLNQLYVNSPTPNAIGREPITFGAGELFDFFNRDGNQTFSGLVAELRVYNNRASFGNDFAALYSELYDKWINIIDSDGDGVPDEQDICPDGDDNVDSDGDLVPDFCDPCPNDAENDADGDGVCGDVDTCPGGNDNENADGDALPDFCDVCPLDPENDADGDGICESDDNCPLIANDNQNDIDEDNIGDACDDDIDGDTVLNETDNCPYDSNTEQTDTDGDGAGDVCDADDDNDGVLDADDACVPTPLGEVVNADGCSIGELCPCAHPDGADRWKNHGAYVRCVAHTSEDFVSAGLITEVEKDAIVSEAGGSSCGHKN